MFLGGVGRLMRAMTSGTSLSPISLFAFGEQGLWYDNSDNSTLFQDSTGTTPAVLEQPVGLRLDKSRGLSGLGTQNLTNGDFASGTTGWTGLRGSISASGGQMTVSGGAGTFPGLSQSFATAVGSSYSVSFTIVSMTVNAVRLVIRDGSDPATGTILSDTTYTSTGSKAVRFVAASANAVFYLIGETASAITYVVSNASVKTLGPGNHAYQTTNDNRPTLSARYNLLTDTDLLITGWTGFGVNRTTVSTPTPIGTSSASKITVSSTATAPKVWFVNLGITVTSSSHTALIYAKASEMRWIYLRCDNGGVSEKGVYFDVLNGVKGTEDSGAVGAINPVGNGWYRCSVTSTLTAGTGYGAIQLASADGVKSFSGTNGEGVLICGADLRVANESSALPPYQRVNTSTDYDSSGFPRYLRYNGTNSWMRTDSIDFSAGPTNPPTVGAELVTNGDFSNGTTGWTAADATIAVTSGEMVVTSAPGVVTGRASQSFATVIGRWYKFTGTRRDGTASASIRIGTTDGGSQIANLTTGESNTVYFLAAGTTTWVSLLNTSGGTGFYDNISVYEIPAAYAPDKMSVFAGVRKLSDSLEGMLVELSTDVGGNAGTFWMRAPADSTYRFDALSRGSASLASNQDALTSESSYLSPFTAILTGQHSISTDATSLRINSVLAASASGDQGSGSFGNYALYIGSRAGSSRWFSGRDYGLVIVGKQVNATELTNTENYMDTQTFGKDMVLVYSDELTTATGDLITAADGDQIYMTSSYV